MIHKRPLKNVRLNYLRAYRRHVLQVPVLQECKMECIKCYYRQLALVE